MAAERYGELGTIVGRYYAMDRDKRWERIRVNLKIIIHNSLNKYKIAYDALIGGIVPEGGTRTEVDRAVETVQSRYAQQPQETDEFLKPIVFSDDARIKSKIPIKY